MCHMFVYATLYTQWSHVNIMIGIFSEIHHLFTFFFFPHSVQDAMFAKCLVVVVLFLFISDPKQNACKWMRFESMVKSPFSSFFFFFFFLSVPIASESEQLLFENHWTFCRRVGKLLQAMFLCGRKFAFKMSFFIWFENLFHAVFFMWLEIFFL